MFECFKCSLKNWVRFTNARTSRTDFWYTYLAMAILSIPASIACCIPMIIGAITGDYEILGITTAISYLLIGILCIPMMLISYSSMARRLTDAGYPWALIFLNLVGFGIVPLIMACLPTKATYYNMPYVGVRPAEPEPVYQAAQPQYQQPVYQAPAQPVYQAPAQPVYQAPAAAPATPVATPVAAPVEPVVAPANDSWFCPNCGTANTLSFCSTCGSKKPE